MLAMLAIGLGLLGLAVLLWFLHKSSLRSARALSVLPTSTAREVRELCEAVAKEIGAGSFAEVVEVKGVANCPQPLESEFGRTPCIYYASRVIREYETREEYEDTNKQRQWRTVRKNETVASNSARTRFALDDGTGTILVDPEGADLSAPKALERFKPEGHRASASDPSFFGMVFEAVRASRDADDRTLGYRYVEEVIPTGARLYVVGEATDNQGQLVVRKPSTKDRKFIISLKSEEDLIKSHRSTARWLQAGAAASAVAGAVLMVLSFFQG